jgi:GNAT superfamily N-acetyltransferase
MNEYGEYGEVGNQQARASSDEGTLALRPRVAGDDARVVEIYSQQEADSLPLTIARYQAEHAEKTVGPRGSEAWVAQDPDGLVVGPAVFHPAWWTGQPDIYALDIRVDPSHGRQGIGSRLYDLLHSRLLLLQANPSRRLGTGRRFSRRLRKRPSLRGASRVR